MYFLFTEQIKIIINFITQIMATIKNQFVHNLEIKCRCCFKKFIFFICFDSTKNLNLNLYLIRGERKCLHDWEKKEFCMPSAWPIYERILPWRVIIFYQNRALKNQVLHAFACFCMLRDWDKFSNVALPS